MKGEIKVYDIFEAPEEVLKALDFTDEEIDEEGDPDYLFVNNLPIAVFINYRHCIVYEGDLDPEEIMYLKDFGNYILNNEDGFRPVVFKDVRNYSKYIKWRGGQGYLYYFFAKEEDKKEA